MRCFSACAWRRLTLTWLPSGRVAIEPVPTSGSIDTIAPEGSRAISSGGSSSGYSGGGSFSGAGSSSRF